MKRAILTAALMLGLTTGVASAQYVSQWAPTVEAACAVHGCDPGYLLNIIACESGGNPNAWHANPYGGADVGLLQINDATWGDVAYADGATQIWWAAAHLGTVWWACG